MPIVSGDMPTHQVRFGLTPSKDRLLALLQNLQGTVRSLKLPHRKTIWHDYYDKTNYSPTARTEKETIIKGWLRKQRPGSVWDAGANNGTFSRLASSLDIPTIASDIDPLAIESAYTTLKRTADTNLLPLVIDLTNPSPAIGWNTTERSSFLSRISVDTTFCLAFIHHLAIANNLPLPFIAKFFAEHTQNLIIEFVPKEDSNAARLLAAREDIFVDYHQEWFEKAFSQYFAIHERTPIQDSTRTLYYMKRRSPKL